MERDIVTSLHDRRAVIAQIMLKANKDSTEFNQPEEYVGGFTSPDSEANRASGDFKYHKSLMSQDASEKRKKAAWPESMGKEAFQGVAGCFVELVEPHSEADPAALLAQFLVAAGNMAGRSPYFEVEADRHRLNLFIAIVGETSKGRKGTSWGHARKILVEADSEWRKRIMSGMSSGEGVIWQVRDPIFKQEPIKENRIVVGYQDVQADPGVKDKRLLVLESELASTLRVIGREGNTLSAITRQAWDDGTLQTLTKNSPAVATDAHISIIGHITRDEFRRYLDRTEVANGFANRFLLVCARRARVLPEGGKIKEVDFTSVVTRLREVARFTSQEVRLTKTDNAKGLWSEVYPELSEGKPGLLGAITGRAEAQVMRLAALYAVLDLSRWIDVPHLVAALEFWSYAESSARYIFGDAIGDPVADEILTLLRATPEGVSRTEIRDLFKRHKSKGQIDRALGVLEDNGLATMRVTQTEGRPLEKWFSI